jgi:hypothetical protein
MESKSIFLLKKYTYVYIFFRVYVQAPTMDYI